MYPIIITKIKYGALFISTFPTKLSNIGRFRRLAAPPKNEIVNNKTSICTTITGVTCLFTDPVVLEFDGFE